MKQVIKQTINFLIVLATLSMVVGYPVLHLKYELAETVLQVLTQL